MLLRKTSWWKCWMQHSKCWIEPDIKHYCDCWPTGLKQRKHKPLICFSIDSLLLCFYEVLFACPDSDVTRSLIYGTHTLHGHVYVARGDLYRILNRKYVYALQVGSALFHWSTTIRSPQLSSFVDFVICVVLSKIFRSWGDRDTFIGLQPNKYSLLLSGV